MANDTPWWANYLPAGVAGGTALGAVAAPVARRLGTAALSAARTVGGFGANVLGRVSAPAWLANGAATTYDAMNKINSDPSMVDNNMMMDPEMGPMRLGPAPPAPPGVQSAASAAGIPLPTPRPYTGDYGWGNSDPYGLGLNPQVRQMANSAGISVPMPRPRPLTTPPTPQVAPPQDPQSYFRGPGAMNFGAGDSPSGTLYGQDLGPQGATGPDLIKKFMAFMHRQGPTGDASPPDQSGSGGGFSLFG